MRSLSSWEAKNILRFLPFWSVSKWETYKTTKLKP